MSIHHIKTASEVLASSEALRLQTRHKSPRQRKIELGEIEDLPMVFWRKAVADLIGLYKLLDDGEYLYFRYLCGDTPEQVHQDYQRWSG